MMHCKECGAYVADGFDKCPTCGKSLRGNERKKPRDDAWDIYEDNGYKGGAATCQQNNRRKQTNKTEHSERAYDGEVIDERLTTETRILAAVSYWSWLFLAPLLLKRNDPYVKFHLNQGIILFIISMVSGWFGFVGTIVWIFCFVMRVWGFFNAIGGKETRIPFVGDIQILK